MPAPSQTRLTGRGAKAILSVFECCEKLTQHAKKKIFLFFFFFLPGLLSLHRKGKAAPRCLGVLPLVFAVVVATREKIHATANSSERPSRLPSSQRQSPSRVPAFGSGPSRRRRGAEGTGRTLQALWRLPEFMRCAVAGGLAAASTKLPRHRVGCRASTDMLDTVIGVESDRQSRSMGSSI